MAIKTALGRGLSALIPATPAEEKKGMIAEIEVAKIHPNPYQPRSDFDRSTLEELKNSIKEKGIIQPITVRKISAGYQLIAGERRLRAVAEIGYKTIPAYIVDVHANEELLEMALIENIQREKLNPIELATSFQRLIDECHLTQDEVAKKIGKDRSTITNFIRLLKLPDKIKNSLKSNEITMGHARALITLRSEDEQIKIWKKIVKETLSVRNVETLVNKIADKDKGGTSKSKNKKKSSYLGVIEEKLRNILGTQVRIREKKEGGQIEIDYYSNEDMERLVEMFELIERNL
jgi:ParB family chromosome partitioning protein